MNSLVEKALFGYMRFHDKVYQGTHGWIGHRMMWIPSLLLHTIGAKTGEPRTASLAYGRDGEDYLVTASNGGASRPPGWYHNLKAHPDVEINVGPKRFSATARPSCQAILHTIGYGKSSTRSIRARTPSTRSARRDRSPSWC